MATAKKHIREKSAYPGFKKAAEEEFGDTLWYLAALCRRMQIPLEEVFAEAANHGNFKNVGAASDMTEGALARWLAEMERAQVYLSAAGRREVDFWKGGGQP